MVDEKRIKELEAIDRRFNMRRRLTVVLFVVLSVALVLYAAHIELKVQRLSESSAVVVYKNVSTQSIDDSNGSIASDSNITQTTEKLPDIYNSNNVLDENKTVIDTEDVILQADETAVYYVTVSGDKCHISGCAYLTNTKREIKASEILSGGYAPCSRCIKE